MADDNLIIEASAGTGKTHRLTNHILRYLALGEEVSAFLAATFTRKAAGEIKARLFSRLASAAQSPDQSAALSRELQVSDIDYQEILLKLISKQHVLNICTLDGFFVQIATLFCAELGLPFQWNIVDRAVENSLRIDAVGRAIEQLHDKKQESERLAFLHLLNAGKPTRSIQGRLERLTDELDRFYYDTKDASWDVGILNSSLEKAELEAVITRLTELGLPTNKDGKTANSYWKKAIPKCITLIEVADWESFLNEGLVQKVILGESEFGRKKITDEFREALEQLASHAHSKLSSDHRSKSLATRHLLELFHQALDSERETEGWMRFSDITHILEEQGNQLIGPELYYRLDSKIRHLLLDEFQDTSISQWNILKPLVEEIVSQENEERSFFCVGDAKQAIYGWRGGVSTIFGHLSETFPQLEVEPLHESRRMRPSVVKFVNKIFEDIPSNLALNEYPQAREEWHSLFKPHSAFNKDVEGACRISLFEDESEKSELQQTCELILQLHTRHPEMEIGVLTRKSDPVEKISRELTRINPKVTPSREVGSQLYRSEAVRLICSLLRMSEHPSDTLSQFHVKHSKLAKFIEPSANAVRMVIYQEGLAAAITRWSTMLFDSVSQEDRFRLNKLCELAHSFECKLTLRLSEFIQIVENTTLDNPFGSKIRLMNIHQSKGLEFDIVVIADLDRALFSKSDAILTYRENPMSKAELATCLPKKVLLQGNPALNHIFNSYREKGVIEQLCLLYVAITRAKYGVFGQLSSSSSKFPETFSGILRSALDPSAQGQAGDIIFELGNIDSLPSIPKRQEESSFQFDPSIFEEIKISRQLN